MNPRSAPRAATWLLVRLGSGPRFDSLIGDLLEQFEEGRSRLWYWKQATGALGGHFLRMLRTHAPSFIGAIVAGCLLTSLWQLGCSRAFQSVYANLAEVKQHPWTLHAYLRLAGMQADMAVEYALYLTSAWLVTRVHRAHQRAIVVAFALALLVQHLPAIVRLVFAGAAQTGFAVSFWTQVILAALQVACTLVAGFWVIQTTRFAEMGRLTRIVAISWMAHMFVTCLLFDACRVGEVTYRRSEFYLSMFGAGAVGGLYLAWLLWRQTSVSRRVMMTAAASSML